jgi:hypothetical protein
MPQAALGPNQDRPQDKGHEHNHRTFTASDDQLRSGAPPGLGGADLLAPVVVRALMAPSGHTAGRDGYLSSPRSGGNPLTGFLVLCVPRMPSTALTSRVALPAVRP